MRIGKRTFAKRYTPPGSATFRNGYNEPGAPAMTLDETLEALEIDKKRRAYIKARKPSREQLFAAANMIAAGPASKKRVKLPVFSIQQD